MIKGEFTILQNGVLQYYSTYESIPASFDSLIRCEFEFPPEPHTPEQHEQIEKYTEYLKDLMSREKGNASSN
jgi:hypothetical protein